MNLSSRPKSFLHCLCPSLSIPSLFLRWVSTATIGAPSQLPQNPEEHLRMFFQDRIDHDLDYELSLISALKSCSSLSAVFQGQQIHSLVLKSGLQADTFIGTSLINMYSKCGFLANAESLFNLCSKVDTVSCTIMLTGYLKFGQLYNARHLFEIMPGKDCFSYTTMIMGLAQNDCWTEAIEVFKDMRSAGVVPTEVSMAQIISSFLHVGGIWACRMLHALVIKMPLQGSVLVSTNLVRMYCCCWSVGDGRHLFDEMPERNIVSWNVMLNGYSKGGIVGMARELFERIPTKDVVSWGTIIDCYMQVECLSEALMMYKLMCRTGLGPNDVIIVDIISSCGQLMATGEGQQFHGIIIKAGFDCYGIIQATIINFYAACGIISLARLQFEVGIKDHLSSCNTLISGYIRSGMIEQARELFIKMPERNVVSWSTMISGYMRSGMIEQARELFIKMPERNVFSWSTMISGYTQNEQPNLALDTFHEMIASGIQPNEITMLSVFSAIATLGTLSIGRWCHEYVRKNSIPLKDSLSAALIDMYAKCGSISTSLDVFYEIYDKATTAAPWNAIIFGLARHGHAKLSLKIFYDLQKLQIKLNSITFIGVLSACSHAGLVEDGERYFKSMKDAYNIEPNIEHYGCMVDLLGRAGRLQEAEETITSMPMKADSVIWGTLLAACRTHGNVEIGERAAKSLARLKPSHGADRVLLSNIYADAGKLEEVFSVRESMRVERLKKLPGHSVVL